MKTISAFLLSLVLLCPLAYSQTNISGYAISLNGSADLLSVPQNVWFSGDLTIEGWVYVRHYNSWSRLIDFSDGPDQYNVYLALSDGTTGQPHMGVFTNGGGPQLASSAQLPTNQWAHLAATIHNGVGTIYINGKVTGTGPMIPAPNRMRTNNYIGKSPYLADTNADAIFDELRIWSVARSQNDIQANMNHPLAGNEPGLLPPLQLQLLGGRQFPLLKRRLLNWLFHVNTRVFSTFPPWSQAPGV